MAPLTERQKKAQWLAAELGRCAGTWVITPLPLDESARALRFQLLDSERDAVISELCEAGWIPSMVQGHPRFTPSGLIPASLYEVVIEKDRTPIVDTPKIEAGMVELAERQARAKAAAEVKAFRKAIGFDK
jgi:hypothetical protein